MFQVAPALSPSFSTLYLWKCGNRCSIPFYCMNIFKRRPWFVTVFLSVAQFASLSSVRVNSLPRYYNFVIHDHYNNGRFPRFSQNRNGMLSWPWMASDGSASFSFSFSLALKDPPHLCLRSLALLSCLSRLATFKFASSTAQGGGGSSKIGNL